MKSVLLYSLLVGGSHAAVVSSDRFLIKILDRTISLQDIKFQQRNLKGLNCIYEDAFVIQYFSKAFIQELEEFLKNMPTEEEKLRQYLHSKEELLKDVRYFFKMLRYARNQKAETPKSLINLVRESVSENKCDKELLYKDTLKTNFLQLLELELYLRARYGGQLKSQASFKSIRPSIELFVESLDKQFNHEYYW